MLLLQSFNWDWAAPEPHDARVSSFLPAGCWQLKDTSEVRHWEGDGEVMLIRFEPCHGGTLRAASQLLLQS